MITTLQAAAIDHFGIGNDEQAQARRTAGKMFDRVHAQARRGTFWAKLTGKSRYLSGVPRKMQANRRAADYRIVSLDKIVGSEGRTEDFDADFRPLKSHDRERWIGVAAARRMGVVLPPVDLIQVGDEYYVRDGHHRISTARAMGQLEIDGRVVN